MDLELNVYKTQRVVPVRFATDASYPLRPDYPEIDDRGHGVAPYGPIVGMTEGRTAHVKLMRERIAPDAALYVTSSDPGVVRVNEPAPGKAVEGDPFLGSTIQLAAAPGAGGGKIEPRVATIRAHHGSPSGPVLQTLTVWVFSPLTVHVTPHLVETYDGSNQKVATGMDEAKLAEAMDLVRAIYLPCGIAFQVGAARRERVKVGVAGIVGTDHFGKPECEVNRVLTTNPVPSTINVHFVPQIGETPLVGYGFSPKSAPENGMQHLNGILAADKRKGNPIDDQARVQLLGHEIGHFFTLWHPAEPRPGSGKEFDFLEDSWSRRLVMFNGMLLPKEPNNWKAMVGYGDGKPGCLVTMKDVGLPTTRGQCMTARRAIGAKDWLA